MEIAFAVPQGSILDSLLFSISLVDMFFIINNMDIANYANDNMTYANANDIDTISNKILWEFYKVSSKFPLCPYALLPTHNIT